MNTIRLSKVDVWLRRQAILLWLLMSNPHGYGVELFKIGEGAVSFETSIKIGWVSTCMCYAIITVGVIRIW
jgi:hypothetical protein